MAVVYFGYFGIKELKTLVTIVINRSKEETIGSFFIVKEQLYQNALH